MWSINKGWSKTHRKVLFYIRIDGTSKTLICDLEHLEQLKDLVIETLERETVEHEHLG